MIELCDVEKEESYLYESFIYFLPSANISRVRSFLYIFYFHFIRLVNVLSIKLFRSLQRQELTVKKYQIKILSSLFFVCAE